MTDEQLQRDIDQVLKLTNKKHKKKNTKSKKIIIEILKTIIFIIIGFTISSFIIK